MQLVVYSKESLDKIQSLVEDKFQQIQSMDRSCSQFPGQPCTSEHLQILVRAVPIKQGHKLRIMWPVTASIRHYKEAPCSYLGHLIGHEGEGLLYFVLKMLDIICISHRRHLSFCPNSPSSKSKHQFPRFLVISQHIMLKGLPL